MKEKNDDINNQKIDDNLKIESQENNVQKTDNVQNDNLKIDSQENINIQKTDTIKNDNLKIDSQENNIKKNEILENENKKTVKDETINQKNENTIIDNQNTTDKVEKQVLFKSELLKTHEFDALIYRHEDQSKLLQGLSGIDLKLFFGYLSSQFIVASFVVTNNTYFGIFERLGLLFIDIALTFVLYELMKRNFIRRVEVTETIKNCNEALGFNETNVYLTNKSINAKTTFKPWFKGMGYKMGLIITFIGVVIILFIPYLVEIIKNCNFPLYLK